MAFENVFMRLKAVLDADTRGLHAGMAEARADATATAQYIDRQEGSIDVSADLSKLEVQEKRIEAKRREIDRMRADIEVSADISDLDKMKAALANLDGQLGTIRQRKKVLTALSTDLVKQQALMRDLQTRKEKYQAAGAKSWVARMNNELKKTRQIVRDLQNKTQVGKNLLGYDERQSAGLLRMISATRQLEADETKLAAMHDDLADKQRRNTFELDRNRRGILSTIWGLGKMTKSLSEVRIHMGLFSVTVKQLGLLLGALGPVILSVLGTLGALVGTIGAGLAGALQNLIGVLGAGIAGAAVVGGAGLTAMGLSAFGLVQALAGADERMERMGKHWSKLQKAFQSKTGSARDSFFGLMESALERAKALMPAFARNTNEFAASLKVAGENFMQAFNVREMRSSMNTIMGNFSASLPALGEALGNIAEGLSNIFASASRAFGPISDGILKWSEGFRDANQAGAGLDSTIDSIVGKAESLIHFFAAAGRSMKTLFGAGAGTGQNWIDGWTESLNAWNTEMNTASGAKRMADGTASLAGHAKTLAKFLGSAAKSLTTFFGTGAGAGKGLMADMTKGLDDWNERMKTAEGQEGLKKFFADSVELAKDLWAALGGVFDLFVAFSEAMRPVVEGMTDLLNIVIDIGRAIGSLPVIGDVLGLGLTGVGALAAGGIIGRMATKLPLVGGAIAGVGAKAALSARGMLGMSAAATAATAGVGVFGKSAAGTAKTAGTLGKGMIAARAGTMGLLGPIGAAAAAGYVAYEGIKALTKVTYDYDSAQATLGKRMVQEGAQGFAQQASSANGLRLQIMDLGDELQAGGERGRRAILTLRQSFAALRQPIQAARSQLSSIWEDAGPADAYNDVIGDLGSQSGGRYKMFAELEQRFGTLQSSLRKNGELTDVWRSRLEKLGVSKTELDNLTESLDAYGRQQEKITKGVGRFMAIKADMARQQRGMDPLGGGAQEALGVLSKEFGRKRVLKWSVKIDSAEAQTKVLNLGKKLTEIGGGAYVAKIMASDKDADWKVKKLRRGLETLSGRPWIAKLIGKDGVSGIANKVKGGLQDVAGNYLARITGQDNASGPARQAKGTLMDVVGNYVAEIAERGAGGVMSVLGGILGNLWTMMSRVWTVTLGTKGGGNFMGGIARDVGPPEYAAGGAFSRRVGKMGGKFSSPTYLVGEEDRREWVIAENPAYRKSNLNYLQMAARALGQTVMPGFAQGGAYQAGAVPVDTAQGQYDRAKSRLDKAKDREERMEDRIKKLRRKKNPGYELVQARQQEKDAERDRKRAQDAATKAKKRLRATKSAHKSRDGIDAEISRDQAEMDSARARGATGAFGQWRTELIEDIDRLLGALRPASRKATGQYKTELQTRIAELEGQRARAGRETMGAEAMLSGAETARLQRLQGMQSYAQTTEGVADDIEANRGLVSFWEGVLGRLTRGPQSSWDWEAVAEASNNLSGARDASISGGGGGIASAGQVFSNARMDLYKQFGSNTAWQDASVAGHSQQNGATIVNNWSQPPPDPHTWSEQQAWEVQAL